MITCHLPLLHSTSVQAAPSPEEAPVSRTVLRVSSMFGWAARAAQSEQGCAASSARLCGEQCSGSPCGSPGCSPLPEACRGATRWRRRRRRLFAQRPGHGAGGESQARSTAQGWSGQREAKRRLGACSLSPLGAAQRGGRTWRAPCLLAVHVARRTDAALYPPDMTARRAAHHRKSRKQLKRETPRR
jgi:hypothetical protein